MHDATARDSDFIRPSEGDEEEVLSDPAPKEYECVLRLSPDEHKVVWETLEAIKHYQDTTMKEAPGKVFLLQTDVLIVVIPSDTFWRVCDQISGLSSALERGNRKVVGKPIATRLIELSAKLRSIEYSAKNISSAIDGIERMIADNSMSRSWAPLRRVLAGLQQNEREMAFVTPPVEA